RRGEGGVERRGGPSWSPVGGEAIVFLHDGSQGNRTRATMKDSVAQIGLDKWTRREPGEKLGGEGDHAHPRGDGTCHCNHKDWSPFPKPRADWLTRVVPKGRRSCGCAMP